MEEIMEIGATSPHGTIQDECPRLQKVIHKTTNILKIGIKILLGVGCFALQPNLAVTITVLSFCKPGEAENIRWEVHRVSQLFTWKKAGYAALVVFLACYALPVTQCVLTSYLAIELGTTLRHQLTQEHT